MDKKADKELIVAEYMKGGVGPKGTGPEVRGEPPDVRPSLTKIPT